MIDTVQDAHESVTVQTLWIGATVPALVRLCLRSFLARGHDVHVYAYEEPAGLPAGIELMEARQILPGKRVFRYGARAGAGEGSLAGFSNLFRYRLLLERGGLWADADVFCLRRFDFPAGHLFAAEWLPGERKVSATVHGAVVRAPAGSPVMEHCYRTAALRRPRDLAWGEIGNELLSVAVERFGLAAQVVAPWVFCPVAWWEMVGHARGTRRFRPDPRSYGVHLYHDIWRRLGLEPSASPIHDTLARTLEAATGSQDG